MPMYRGVEDETPRTRTRTWTHHHHHLIQGRPFAVWTLEPGLYACACELVSVLLLLCGSDEIGEIEFPPFQPEERGKSIQNRTEQNGFFHSPLSPRPLSIFLSLFQKIMILWRKKLVLQSKRVGVCKGERENPITIRFGLVFSPLSLGCVRSSDRRRRGETEAAVSSVRESKRTEFGAAAQKG